MKTLASTENIPLDLAVDPPNGKIYWVEETAGTKYSIMQCGIGDGIVAEVYSVQTVSGLGPLSIAVNTASGNIIWCRYQTSALVNGLWYSPLSSVPLAPVKLVNNVPEPYAYSMSVDSINGRVYLTANSYHDLGTALGSGNTGGIFVYDIDTSGLVASYTDTGSSSESIPFKGVAVDPAGGHVYYISKTLAYYNLIRRRDLNLENAETWVAVSGDNIQKLALDLVNRKIYWTSEAGGGIYRADMDTADSNVEIFLQPGSAVAGIAVSQ